jgi:S-adenosylmethionine:tRNA ribosyltransferase-isomerase
MGAELELADYDFELPAECIAQHPTPERDGARMLVLDRASASLTHASVRELSRWIHPGDLLVVNTSRVVPARLRGCKASGGRAELLLLAPLPSRPARYRALLRCRGRKRVGLKLRFGSPPRALDAEVVQLLDTGEVVVAVGSELSPYEIGEAPLPPYIRREHPDPADLERYQTVYARVPGSAAAPTAGLHLSDRVLDELEGIGVERAEVILHVGLGTFQPPGPRELASGRLHPERFELPEEAAAAVARTGLRGGRVVAVGTTTTRVLEACAGSDGRVRAGCGETDLFVRPPWRFRVVDALLTNFHLPRSSLLMLVAAFAGRERILAAYTEAVKAGYRFYSYGDAMLIL